MNKYKVVFEYKDAPDLDGTIVFNDQFEFDFELAQAIVDEYNNNPALSMFQHRLEVAE